MPEAASQYLDDDIRHQIDLIFFQNYVVAELLSTLSAADDDMKARMFMFFENGGHDVEGFLAGESAQNERLARDVQTALESHVMDLIREETGAEIAALIAILWPGANVNSGLTEIPVIVGRNISEWMSAFASQRERIVNSSVRMSISDGSGFSFVKASVFGRSGLFAGTKRGLSTIIRTSLTAAAASVRETIARANTWLIKSLRYTAVLDSKTTARCRSLDGNIYLAGVGPRPPQHPNCRSFMTFVFHHYSKFGLKNPPKFIKDRFTGEPPNRPNYTTWLRGQPSSVQNDALGARRAEMFRKNKSVTMKTFVNRQGRQLTLEELTSRR